MPLVGSENHILPFILNSNDFEPSTERQEILLDGAEFRKDESRNMDIPSDVGINRYILKKSYELFERITKFFSANKYNYLHLLARGLKTIPKVKKYFNEKWYEENYMKKKNEYDEKSRKYTNLEAKNSSLKYKYKLVVSFFYIFYTTKKSILFLELILLYFLL